MGLHPGLRTEATMYDELDEIKESLDEGASETTGFLCHI